MRQKARVALLFANILLGMNFAIYNTLITKYIDYKLLLFLGIATSAILFAPLVIKKHNTSFKSSEIIKIVFVTLLILFGREYYVIKGSQYTSSLDASTLAAAVPIFTLALSSIVQKEQLHTTKLIGISLLVIGWALLIFHNFGYPEQKSVAMGNIMILTGVFASAINTIVIKPVLMRHSSSLIIGWCYILGCNNIPPIYI